MRRWLCCECLQNVNWFWIGILTIFLVSCAQEPSVTPAEMVEANVLSTPVSPGHDATNSPTTATLLPTSPTSIPTLEIPTDTPSPTETPTLTPSLWPTSEPFFDGARVTFINNAGFLITVGDKKILIDALYETQNKNTAPPQDVVQRIIQAAPPFDQIDLVIATHNHPDHFSADLVMDYLRNNDVAIFVSSPDAVRQIESSRGNLSERLIQVYLEPGESLQLSVNGIDLDCLYITHGDRSILNIGFVVTVGNYSFFHSGDMNVDNSAGDAVSLADLQGFYPLLKDIDLAFLPSHIFSLDEYTPLIVDGIQARYVSPMHYLYRYPPVEIEENFSNAVVFKDAMESWVIPAE